MTTEYSGGGDVSVTLALLWGTRERPSRGPKPGLTLERIVATAIGIADAEGLEAVSMRRVAAELGMGTMSLYRYVPGKSELLDLMLDRVSDPGNAADRMKGQDWRRVLETYAFGLWDLYTSHSWLLQVNWARPLLGPSSLAGLELLLQGLRDTGLTDQERMMAIVAMESYVTGAARRYMHVKVATERTGVSEDEFWAAQTPALERALASGEYPALAQLSEEAFGASHEQTFAFGLERLLDGVEDLLERRPNGSSAAVS
jgi:AcrR family transcriptional regulator